MSFARLIPCLDVTAGRVVKGVNFLGLTDVGDPTELAEHYSRGGADELVFLDISATPTGSSTMVEVVRKVSAAVTIPFTVGGGIRTVADASAIIEAGADRVSLNSAALSRPSLITEIADRFGAQAVVVAIDAGNDGLAYSAGGRIATQRDVVAWAIEAAERGAGEILLTAIGRDGTRQGYDLELTARVRSALGVSVIASGGAGSAQDVVDVLAVTEAALVASIVHENPGGLPALRAAIESLGVELRPLFER